MLNHRMSPVGFIYFNCLAEILKTAGRSGASQPEEGKIWKERHLSPVGWKCRYLTHIRLKRGKRTADVHCPCAECEPKKQQHSVATWTETKHSGKRSETQGHDSFIVNKSNRGGNESSNAWRCVFLSSIRSVCVRWREMNGVCAVEVVSKQ